MNNRFTEVSHLFSDHLKPSLKADALINAKKHNCVIISCRHANQRMKGHQRNRGQMKEEEIGKKKTKNKEYKQKKKFVH